MIVLNPLAWIGFAAVAVPIAVHLLARRQATRVRFPTLRFLVAAELASVRRSRPTEPLLLAVRIAIVAAAVTALAQPLWMTSTRAAANSAIARAVIIDAGIPIDKARAEVAKIDPPAAASRTIETANLAAGLRAANGWLAQTAGRPEVVVLSAFRVGSLSREDLDLVSANARVRLIAISTPIATGFDRSLLRRDGTTVSTHVDAQVAATSVQWISSTAAGVERPLIAVGPASRPAIEAAVTAAIADAGIDAAWPAVEIVWPDASERAARANALKPLDRPWMFDTIEKLRHDEALSDVARRVTSEDSALLDGAMTVMSAAAGGPLLRAGRVENGGSSRLTLFPGSSDPLLAAAIVAALARSERADVAALDAHEPNLIPAAELASWERPGGPGRQVAPNSDDSDGRWFWALALALLGFETWLRRERSTTTTRRADARVA